MITIRVTVVLPCRSASARLRVCGTRLARPVRRGRVIVPIATLSVVPLYAAYGSNMEPAQMLERAPHSPMAGSGWLEGWRLTFGGEDLGWEGALATIVEDPGSRVFVVLYDVTSLDEAGLDRWEGGELG